MTEPANTSLSSVLAHARAGALDRAWALFVSAGHDRNGNDPAALTLKGRLLKDRAMRSGDGRQRLLREAAAAYAAAAALGDSTYPLINAATLSLLAGEVNQAKMLADRVLARIEQYPDEPETPYYRVATRAEALLLLGRTGEAQAALAEAMALAPRAWEDHASTLRQFALILAVLSEDGTWLDPLRPPQSLHFGGHMSFRADAQATPWRAEIDAMLAEERIGFGYGALAAGADILVAEALLARDAELHLVIPGGIEAFAELSVDPFGSEWRRRFDAVLGRAETIRSVAPVGTPPDQAMIALADEIAMGAALGNARRLASEAVQLLVLADSDDQASSRVHAIWEHGGAARRQRIVIAPREGMDPSAVPVAEPARRGLATLAIRPARDVADVSADAEILSAIKAILECGPLPAAPASFTGEAVVVGYDDLSAAAEAALLLARSLAAAVSVGGHYGVGDVLGDPFSGALRVTGRMLAIAGSAAASAFPGSVCVSEDFAAALEVVDSRHFETEFIGELADPDTRVPVGLYALRQPS